MVQNKAQITPWRLSYGCPVASHKKEHTSQCMLYYLNDWMVLQRLLLCLNEYYIPGEPKEDEMKGILWTEEGQAYQVDLQTT